MYCFVCLKMNEEVVHLSICFICFKFFVTLTLFAVQVYCRHAANQIRETQEFKPRILDIGNDLGGVNSHIIAHCAGSEQDGEEEGTTVWVYVLQRWLPHLLIHGVLLHPHRGYDPPLLAHLCCHSPEGQASCCTARSQQETEWYVYKRRTILFHFIRWWQWNRHTKIGKVLI